MDHQSLTRRGFLSALSAAGLGLAAGNAAAGPAVAGKRSQFGIGTSSYGIHRRARPALREPLRFLEFCRARGAGGIQISLGMLDADKAEQLRRQAEAWKMYVEGSIRSPRDKPDVERFEAEVRSAKRAGATVLRTVMLGGRRYETFRTAEEFRRFREESLRRLSLAEPVVRRHKVTLAVENHKDFRADALVELIKSVSSEYVGVCVDTGNNVALLEDPQETAKTLAPWGAACHLKDMAVAEYADGFLLSEVPLGEGFLDLQRIVRTLSAARPALRFSLEMITRDPLKIPCLSERYWATFPELPGRHLAAALAMVRREQGETPLPRISVLSEEQQLKREEENVRKSVRYAQRELFG